MNMIVLMGRLAGVRIFGRYRHRKVKQRLSRFPLVVKRNRTNKACRGKYLSDYCFPTPVICYRTNGN